MSATAEVAAPPEAPPQAPAEQAPPPQVGPWSAAELGRLKDTAPEVKAGQFGLLLTMAVPFPDPGYVAQVRHQADALDRPVEQARTAYLGGAEHAEYLRRVEALKTAEGNVSYFGQLAREARAEVKQALAGGASPEQAEADWRHAEAEQRRYQARAADLGPLVQQARTRAAAGLRAAVEGAFRQAVQAAEVERDVRRRALAEAVAGLLAPWLAAQLALERVAQRATADRLSELPEPEKKKVP
jgi:hypothetical protein